jgi:hypothetical protein
MEGGVVAPLVGRDAELPRLRDAVGLAARPLEIVVRGDPGIGKTALRQHALRWFDDGSRTWLVGTSTPPSTPARASRSSPRRSSKRPHRDP